MGAPTVADSRSRTGSSAPNGRLRAAPVRRAWNVPWILLGVLLVSGSALAFAVLADGGGGKTAVLALATGISAGEPLTDEALASTEVEAPDSVNLVPASQRAELVGRIAVADLPAGTLVIEALFAGSSRLAPGQALVGVRLDPSAMPVSRLRTGDAVMVVRTPPPADTAEPAPPVVWAATVFTLAPVSSPSGDFTVVSLTVDALDAPAISAAAALDRVRLVLVRSLDDIPPELLFSALVDDTAGGEPGPAGS